MFFCCVLFVVMCFVFVIFVNYFAYFAFLYVFVIFVVVFSFEFFSVRYVCFGGVDVNMYCDMINFVYCSVLFV